MSLISPMCLLLALVAVAAEPGTSFNWSDKEAVEFFLEEVENGNSDKLGQSQYYDSAFFGIFKQNKKDEARRLEYYYQPKARDLKSKVNRHGEEFLECTYVSKDNTTISKKLRCPRVSPIDPRCFVTLAVSPAHPNEPYFSAGCSYAPASTCSPQCTLKQSKQQWIDKKTDVTIQTCCCTQKLCNSDLIGILSKEGNFTNDQMTHLKKDIIASVTSV